LEVKSRVSAIFNYDLGSSLSFFSSLFSPPFFPFFLFSFLLWGLEMIQSSWRRTSPRRDRSTSGAALRHQWPFLRLCFPLPFSSFPLFFLFPPPPPFFFLFFFAQRTWWRGICKKLRSAEIGEPPPPRFSNPFPSPPPSSFFPFPSQLRDRLSVSYTP